MKRMIKVCAVSLFVLSLNFKDVCPIQAQDLQNLVKNAEIGNADSQYMLGKLYMEKAAISNEDRANACKWLRKAAMQNHKEAIIDLCVILGEMYSWQNMASISDPDYMYWMIKSHKLGFAPSFCFLGYAFLEGIPSIKVERNYQKALYYYQDYWAYRPATINGKNHWWEDGALLEKLSSLYDNGYEPSVTNEEPAKLLVVPNSVKVSNNGYIAAGEHIYITLQIKNEGKGDSDYSIVLAEFLDNSGLLIPVVSVPLICPGETKSVIVPITGQERVHKGDIPVSIKVCDPRGFETLPVNIAVCGVAN